MDRFGRVWKVIGGGRGIRTPGTLSGTTVFKTAGINRSPIPPREGIPQFTATAFTTTALPGRYAARLTTGFHVSYRPLGRSKLYMNAVEKMG
jgi:hypothetical protein